MSRLEGCGGSSAVSRRYNTLRTAGAAARELLIAAAMKESGDSNRDNYKAEIAKVWKAAVDREHDTTTMCRSASRADACSHAGWRRRVWRRPLHQ